MLTFASNRDQAQADQLLQPCLIRVIDNLRKHTETLDWHSEYLEQVQWPRGTTEAQQRQVKALMAELDQAPPAAVAQIQQALDQLPTPMPIYELRLTRGPYTASLNLWDLCFQVCFQNFDPEQPAVVDPALLDPKGDIDWITLDEKAKALVAASLAAVTRLAVCGDPPLPEAIE
ncbi:MAG TPA: hypothetical protein IGR64_02505 [Leptolyngbyaceae cyanobacterium M65_K2018_010]|nr:hypothetical protein [Leptolyngbyaceae cyanobacterium M65_K2018_010]